ncbi:MAG: anhydro-N-acetylmuramic acid kinase [Burkholderiaceae bacterium]|nr:anhydro-N-acetylmuramic acid kinase [Roseateles sp.]MBV8470509.1 anhydro-N-acetylmuramic acid kinase [Burkholderiaceae bacterium]
MSAKVDAGSAGIAPGVDPLYIGLMSGTSLDGVDAVLAQFPEKHDSGAIRVLASSHLDFDADFRNELLEFNHPGTNETHRNALAANAIARLYSAAIEQLLDGIAPSVRHAVAAVGAHGQTVRHRPGEFDGCGYTVQLLNGALLAELSGLNVVCDLRSRDVAAGGQGAPLVPAFHQAVFHRPGRDTQVVNIGGISNISLLGDTVKGFDCGPGNCLMDLWIQRHLGQAFDAGGQWAAQGQVLPALLEAMWATPFFHQAPPRSTGRDLFNAAWLDGLLHDGHAQAAPVDVQATLAELTARAIGTSVPAQGGGIDAVLLVCGGGAFNTHLLQRLQALLPLRKVLSTDTQGLPAMEVEAAAFAWLAQRFMAGLSGNLPSVTGAKGPRVLGALYPA